VATTCLDAVAPDVSVYCLFDLGGLGFGQTLPFEYLPPCFSRCVAACTLDGVCVLWSCSGKHGAVSSADATGCC